MRDKGFTGVNEEERAGAAGEDGDGIAFGLSEGGASLEIEIFRDRVPRMGREVMDRLSSLVSWVHGAAVTATCFRRVCRKKREGSLSSTSLLQPRRRLYRCCIANRGPPSSSAASITAAPLFSPSSLTTAGKTKDEEKWSCLADATRHHELAGKRRRKTIEGTSQVHGAAVTATCFRRVCRKKREGSLSSTSLLQPRRRLYRCCIANRGPPSSSAASITAAPLFSPSSLTTAGKTKDEEKWSCLADATRHHELAGKRRRKTSPLV
nr:hypothetical protein Iba_chr11cCG11930 [Ipomoea batatas]